MTWVALRITSADASRDRVEQRLGSESEAHVDLEPGAAHGVEPAVGELFGDQHALHRAEARRSARSGRERFARADGPRDEPRHGVGATA